MNLHLTVLILYSVLLIAVGLIISRRVKKAADFLVAGRTLGPGLIFTTFLAANIGAGSTVGATGLGYQKGLSAWWWVGSAGIGSLILANTFGPKIWRLAKQYDLHTVGDFLDRRYSKAVRGLTAFLLCLGTLAILAGQLIGVSLILNVVIGTPKWQGCLIGGIVVMIYFSAGGLLASAWVNAVQLVVMFAGFLTALPFALAGAGGWPAVAQNVSATRAADYFSFTGIGLEGILGYLVILVPSFIVSPGLIQKLYGARDAHSVRLGVNLNAISLLVYAFIPAILGMIAYSQYPALTDQELALPTVMMNMLPAWLGLLVLAAIFSAEISTCDAILFMLSTSMSVDLYRSFIHPDASEQRLLSVSRATAILGGMLGIGVAILLPSIIAALTLFYGLLAVALFVPMILGLYSAAPTARAAAITIVSSVAVTIMTHVYTGGRGFGILTPYAIGILFAFVVMIGWTRLRLATQG